jgi:Fe2+ transport system protein FeoA
MQAYGLAPGRLVEILQQDPVTVVRADHTELALEDDLARKVLIEVVTP